MYFDTLITTVLFCLGWRIITDEGNLLYFIRRPFEWIWKEIDITENRLAVLPCRHYRRKLKLYTIIGEIGKPLVTCITCMASIWGISIFIALNGFNESLIIPLILNSVSASFIQTFIWLLYVKYIQ